MYGPTSQVMHPSKSKTITLNPSAALNKINKEVAADRFYGPSKYEPIENLIISPIGLREKKVKGTFRLIHNLSYPRKSHSVNSGIPKELCWVKYESFDRAIQLVQKAGWKAEISKLDIAQALSLLP